MYLMHLVTDLATLPCIIDCAPSRKNLIQLSLNTIVDSMMPAKWSGPSRIYEGRAGADYSSVIEDNAAELSSSQNTVVRSREMFLKPSYVSLHDGEVNMLDEKASSFESLSVQSQYSMSSWEFNQ
jgi:hypothetical protein